MAKINQNFQIYKGEVKKIVLTIKDEDGALVPLDSKTMLYRVSKNSKSTTYIIEKDETDCEITGEGTVEIPFDHNDTDEETSGLYYHEFRLMDGTETEVVVMTGKFQLDDSNTNEPTA